MLHNHPVFDDVNHDKGAFISAKQLPYLHPRGAKH
jgi:hypothetical protein